MAIYHFYFLWSCFGSGPALLLPSPRTEAQEALQKAGAGTFGGMFRGWWAWGCSGGIGFATSNKLPWFDVQIVP